MELWGISYLYFHMLCACVVGDAFVFLHIKRETKHAYLSIMLHGPYWFSSFSKIAKC